jgi:4-diphosphocytidyl-2-C-methyl-D-erythritol kinase
MPRSPRCAAATPKQLGKVLVNDLQPAAVRLRPLLRRVLETGLELGAVGAVVSGSGRLRFSGA